MSEVEVKICGLSDEESIEAAIEAGADYVGVVLFPKSPRAVSLERAAELLSPMPEEVVRVALLVDADDRLLDRVMNHVRVDLLQFHGAETPERIEQVQNDFGIPVMKALGISTGADLDAARPFAEIAEKLMFDARAPKGADRPGGHGAPFDWSILAGRQWPCPWMLAGGLTPDNVAEAIRISGARAVDVSSGVESAPGVKDAALIARFIAAAKGR